MLRRGGRRGAAIALGAAALSAIALNDMGRRGVSPIYAFVLVVAVAMAVFALAQLRTIRLDPDGFSTRSVLFRRWSAVPAAYITSIEVHYFAPGTRQPPSIDLRIQHGGDALRLSFYVEDEYRAFVEHLLPILPAGLPGADTLAASRQHRWVRKT